MRVSHKIENEDRRIKGFKEAQLLTLMEQKGKELFGLKFRLWTEDIKLISTLLIYILKDEEMAFGQTLDLRKGILLTGPIGCGKTCLMTVIKYFLNDQEQYIVKPARDVSFEFQSEGFETINRYSKKSFHSVAGEMHPKNYCFDDLGLERIVKHYGNECNVMQEVILSRYDLFIRAGMLTHLTTNLSCQQIENRYGEHVLSRLSEMVNFISFDSNANDKRRS
jgi:DNA replication protein DnaC